MRRRRALQVCLVVVAIAVGFAPAARAAPPSGGGRGEAIAIGGERAERRCGADWFLVSVPASLPDSDTCTAAAAANRGSGIEFVESLAIRSPAQPLRFSAAASGKAVAEHTLVRPAKSVKYELTWRDVEAHVSPAVDPGHASWQIYLLATARVDTCPTCFGGSPFVNIALGGFDGFERTTDFGPATVPMSFELLNFNGGKIPAGVVRVEFVLLSQAAANAPAGPVCAGALCPPTVWSGDLTASARATLPAAVQARIVGAVNHRRRASGFIASRASR